jgi:membrane peptidoglycan carboxypeptidase
LFFQEQDEPKRILLYDRNWIKITDKWNEFWYKIEISKKDFEKIKKTNFVKSLIKIEDKNFYSHWWVDFLAKLRAIKDNLSWNKISWASTITEQFLKNKYFLGKKRTYLQKAREAFLAMSFSLVYDKDEILRKYLNSVFLGNNLYWIKTASKVYFNKKIENLNSQEIVVLLSLINYPSTKSLSEKSFFNYAKKIAKRLNIELKNDFWKIKLNKFKAINKFPFVTENNIKTIDSKLQEYTKEVIKNTLDELKWKNVTNAAVFAIIPKTKEILIYQWSKDFYALDIDWQVDVIKAKRQPWSTFKPFLYLYAIVQWYWTENLLVDLESEYNSFKNNWKYVSENYSLKEYWLIRFKKALWNSLNNASVRLAKELWLEEVYNFYKKFWFNLNESPDYYWYSLVLWNPSTRLYDLVNNYTKLLINKQDSLKLKQAKFLLYNILSDPDNRDISFWVNSILNTSIKMAVKTWTSSDFRDNLVVSYHPDLVIWVWVWNNDNSSMKWVTGITWAWYIWHKIVEKAIELWYIRDIDLELPKWIEEIEYCLTKNCFQKELIYKRKEKQYFSRIYDKFYSKKDLLEKLTTFEKNKLQAMWFKISE